MFKLAVFKHVQEGQRFRVVWALGEKVLLPPQTVYTRVPKTETPEGSYNATTTVDGRIVGVLVDDRREVTPIHEAAAPEPLVGTQLVPGPMHAQN